MELGYQKRTRYFYRSGFTRGAVALFTRLKFLKMHGELVHGRDDLYLEMISLLNQTGNF